jgi:signal peptidase I
MDILYYIVVFILSYLLPFAGIAKLFELRGEQGWKAFVPVLNFVIWSKIIGKPVWQIVYLFVPILNIFVLATMASDLNKSFSRFSFLDSVLAIALPFVWFPYMGYKLAKDLKYIGPATQLREEFRKHYKIALKAKNENELRRLEREHPIPKKGIVREWADSILFAVFAAHFIRLFLIEAYTIPTPSMEGSLLVGDYLFVSKAHYGSRMPMTPLSFPLLHNVLPITGAECYLPWPKWQYRRAPRFQAVHRYDPVVFNYPEGDTTLKTPNYGDDYYNQLKRVHDLERREQVRAQLKAAFKNKITVRPVDKRDHYIKRCVGLPGDTIEVRDGDLFVNGQPAPVIKGVQHEYYLQAKEGMGIDMNYIKKNYAITSDPRSGATQAIVHTSPEQAEKMKKELAPVLDTFIRVVASKGELDKNGIFPYNHSIYPWNNDHYGPIWIPKKGTKVTLSMKNIEIYQRIITAYEGNTLEIKEGEFKINGVPTNEYTFKMDYFWMMGDNRHNSADSRSWGFVPEDHVVGKPLFVWFSHDGSRIRWNRIFMSALGK